MSNVKEIKIGTTTYDIVGKGVENQRDSSKAKVWVGTNAQYSSLGTLDSDTVYYRTDNGGTVETAANATSATNATNATNDGSGNNIASTYATKTELNQKSSFKLFHHDWFDYLLNDQDWLRADTFSWQDGTVYSDAYNHLVDDIDGKTAQTETIGSYTILYYLADDGHKITTDETTVANIYNESGVAWYYVLDTTNQRFKLPRTKFGFTGLRDTVGKYVAPTLPNITGELDTSYGTAGGTVLSASGAFSGKTSSKRFNRTADSNNGYSIIGFDASDSSSIYQNGATVQPPATQMYLYFYVGQFSQTATEQTAGLNSELFNGKLDLDAANLSTAGKSLISGLGMPSDTYDDLTLLASGNSYTAPANGYYTIDKTTNGAEYVKFENMASGLITQARATASGQSVSLFIPVKQGDEIKCTYSAAGTTNLFRFIYAKGEVNV